jgi:flagellar biosynthetic protein FliS
MHKAYAQQTYKTNNLQSMTPGEQVARLLETAARYIVQAKQSATEKQYEARLLATEDAMKIITGLQGCLHFNEVTDHIATVLQQYYVGITLQITHINVHNDGAMCDTVIDSLRTMARTWRETEQKARQESPTDSTAGTRTSFEEAV